MGCASSTPVVNGEQVHSATGSMGESLAEKAKSATNNAIEAGEQVLNDAGEVITDTVDQVEDTVTDAMSNMKMGMSNALSSGMGFMKDTKDAVTSKAEEMGNDLQEAGDDLMKHVPLKGVMDPDAVEDLMADKMNEADQMADDLIADTQDMMEDVGAKAKKMFSGIPKSMDSFKTGSPEPELQKLEEMMSTTTADSPKPSNNMLELVDLETTPTPSAPMMMTSDAMMTAAAMSGSGVVMAAEITNKIIKHITPTDDSHTIDTTNKLSADQITSSNTIPSILIPDSISTASDANVFGEVVFSDMNGSGAGDDDPNNLQFRIAPPSPRHDGIVLSEPTQWEKFADSIVKSHLDKASRRSGTTSAVAATITSNGGKEEEHHSIATEQNIEL